MSSKILDFIVPSFHKIFVAYQYNRAPDIEPLDKSSDMCIIELISFFVKFAVLFWKKLLERREFDSEE